jgi:hypothetical protein
MKLVLLLSHFILCVLSATSPINIRLNGKATSSEGLTKIKLQFGQDANVESFKPSILKNNDFITEFLDQNKFHLPAMSYPGDVIYFVSVF